MKEWMNKVLEGDCLELLPLLPDGCIDMVLCDLPYGMTNNKWDTPIDLDRLWAAYRRVVKPGGVVALTGSHRFTGQLITSNTDWFRYKIVWIKSKATNFLSANRQPLRRHEDVCIFYSKQCYCAPQKIQGKPYDKGIRRDKKSGNYGSFNTFPAKNETGMRHPCDILFYEEELLDWAYFRTAEADGVFHPTQKPVNLGRWLVRTYSRPGEIILDNACGSGSFLVAALLEGRRFIGMEKNDRSFHFGRKTDFVSISRQRIAKAFRERNQATLFN